LIDARELKICEIISTYLQQINDAGSGDKYAPADLARYIKRLVSHLEDHDFNLLFDYNDDRLSIFYSEDLHKPLYRIYWRY